MTTVSGILEWPARSEGRIRQFKDGFVESPDDPFVPVALGDSYPLRHGQSVTVEVVQRKPRRRRGGPKPPRPVVDRFLEIEGLEPDDAVMRTLVTSGRGIVFNALSVVVGFAVLLISSFLPVKFFGILVVVSITACLVGALALLPALCLLLRPNFLEP